MATERNVFTDPNAFRAPVPSVAAPPSKAPIYDAIGRIGAGMASFGAAIIQARQESAVLKAKVQIGQEMQALELAVGQEPDFEKGSKAFEDGTARIRAQVSELGFDEKTKAHINAAFEGSLLHTSANVKRDLLQKQADDSIASLNEYGRTLRVKAYANPDYNMISEKADYYSAVDGLMSSGIIRSQIGDAEKANFANKLDKDRAAGLIDTDPRRAKDMLEESGDGVHSNFTDLSPGDRDGLLRRAENGIKELDREADRKKRLEQATLPEAERDYLASIRGTGRGNDVTEARVRATEDPDWIARFYRRKRLAYDVFSAKKQMVGAHPSDMYSIVEGFRPESGMTGYVEQDEAFKGALSEMQDIMKARKDDPSGYFSKLPGFKPGNTVEEGITASLRAQEDGGMESYDRRPLPKEVTKATVAKWKDGGTDIRYPLIKEVLDSAGRHSGVVMAKLIEDGIPAWASYYTVVSPRVAGLIGDAYTVKPDQLASLLDEEKKETINSARGAANEHLKSYPPGSERGQAVGQDVAENVALLLAARGDSDPAGTMQRELFGGYEYRGTLRYPKEFEGTPYFSLKLRRKILDMNAREIADQSPMHFFAGMPENVAKDDLGEVNYYSSGDDKMAYAYLRGQPLLSRTAYERAIAAGKSHNDAGLAARIGFSFSQASAMKLPGLEEKGNAYLKSGNVSPLIEFRLKPDPNDIPMP